MSASLIPWTITCHTISGSIQWSVDFSYTSYGGWGERASVTINGADTWQSNGENVGSIARWVVASRPRVAICRRQGCTAPFPQSLPPPHTHTLLFFILRSYSVLIVPGPPRMLSYPNACMQIHRQADRGRECASEQDQHCYFHRKYGCSECYLPGVACVMLALK